MLVKGGTGVFYGVHNWTLGWPIHDLHVMLLQEILCGSGCVQRSIILDQNKVVVEGSSCPALETFLQKTPLYLLVHDAIQYNQLTFVVIEKSSASDDGWLALLSVPCTKTSMCFSPCYLRTWPRPSVWCKWNLDSSVKTKCRQWRMSQVTRWRLAHWRRRQRCTNVS